jgi:hypothetical protein
MKYVFLFFLLTSCANLNPNRTISSSGNDGKMGERGSGGRDGKNGSTVFATGCDDSAMKISESLNKARDIEIFFDGGIEMLCGTDFTKLKDSSKEHISALVDQKIQKALASGYFHPKKLPKHSHFLEKPKTLQTLWIELENLPEVTYPCKDGVAVREGMPEIEVRVCAKSKYLEINEYDDPVTEIQWQAFALENGKPAKYAFMQERHILQKKPSVCKNGNPIYSALESGSSNGEGYESTVISDCQVLDLRFSKIYPDFRVEFKP